MRAPTYFPNPVEHAMVLLEVCGTLPSALATALDNCEFAANDADSLYWFEVAQALKPSKVCA